jgi:hypothetical protein
LKGHIYNYKDSDEVVRDIFDTLNLHPNGVS